LALGGTATLNDYDIQGITSGFLGVTFPGGSSNVTLLIRALTDSLQEPDESVTIAPLANTAIYELASNTSALCTIINTGLPLLPPPTLFTPSSSASVFMIGFSSSLTGFSITHSSLTSIFTVSVTATSGAVSIGNLQPSASVTYSPNSGLGNTSLNIVVSDSNPQNTVRRTVALTPKKGLAVAVTDPTNNNKISLLVQGTLAGDSITVTKNGSSYVVSGYGGARTTLTGITGRIIVYGFEGNDNIDLTSTTIPNLAYGGLGNDIIRSGSAADTLYGEGGADLLAGGIGSDVIWGGTGRDILFDGAVAQFNATTPLSTSLQQWASILTVPTASQYASLTNRFLISRDPGNRDKLNGEADLDLFFAVSSGTLVLRDVLDKNSNESVR
jgi:Ca2+-binding RTX toxin-like protein